MKDVLGSDPDTYKVLVDVDSDGSVVIDVRNNENETVAYVVVENHKGRVMLDYWKNESIMDDPDDTVMLYDPLAPVEQYDYCPKCGQSWAVHEDDGSCVED
jgi:hypothetical protein